MRALVGKLCALMLFATRLTFGSSRHQRGRGASIYVMFRSARVGKQTTLMTARVVSSRSCILTLPACVRACAYSVVVSTRRKWQWQQHALEATLSRAGRR